MYTPLIDTNLDTNRQLILDSPIFCLFCHHIASKLNTFISKSDLHLIWSSNQWLQQAFLGDGAIGLKNLVQGVMWIQENFLHLAHGVPVVHCKAVFCHGLHLLSLGAVIEFVPARVMDPIPSNVMKHLKQTSFLYVCMYLLYSDTIGIWGNSRSVTINDNSLYPITIYISIG